MNECRYTWRNLQFNIPCRCAKKEFHDQDDKDNRQHLCRCEWPGLWPGGMIVSKTVSSGS